MREMPEEIMEWISDAQWNHGKSNEVTITDSYQHNACNHTLSGKLTYKGEELYFIVDIGDWNGFVVRQFGTIDEVGIYEPPKPTQFMFVPVNDNLEIDRPEMWKVYLYWKEQPWFIEKLRNYHYDRHFQPGCFIENHYKNWAASKGLKIVALSQ